MNEATAIGSPHDKLYQLVEHPRFKGSIMGLIALSAVLLGLETARDLPAGVEAALVVLNQLILAVFVIEIVLRIAVHRLSFFRDSWSLFDFAIVVAALVAPTGPFQVVRSLRILRAFRLVSSVPSLRRVVEGLFGAVPGIASVLFLLLLVLYIAAVMATMLFRDVAPEFFGHLGVSLFSLFQIMTLEGWSDIAQEVMAVYEWSWMYFIGYILVATFLVLNLVIGVVVSSIQSRIEAESAALQEDDSEIKKELAALRREISALRESLDRERP
jgi:voltage-gated sodium channel